MNTIELKGITKIFGGLAAVSSLDLTVAKGEIHGLIGPNGSGKSTTLNLISGQYIPTSGQILLGGRDITRVPPAERTVLGIARTFQNIRLFRRLSVLDNVMVSRYCRTRSGLVPVFLRLPSERREEAQAREAALAALRVVDMDGRADALPGDLPYGQQRLVEIARALATDPQVLMLDEPAAGMNPTEKRDLQLLIARLNREHQLTILLVEHDMDLVMAACGRLTVLNFGAKIGEGSAYEVRANPDVIEAYLGSEEAVGA
ncbi:MAG: ABC transporter ATP-binding protein [Actinobacteria bacterium]|nr:ABC transporter ATP-binding protein [Actinomycetota bacterium]